MSRHLALSSLFLLGCHVGGSDRSWDLPGDLRGVDLRLSNGSITVQPAPSDRLVIEWSGGGVGNGNVFPEPELIDDVVWFDARCGEACGGDLLVWLPPGMEVYAELAKGDVSVELEERSDLHACAAMGSVDIRVPQGAWDLQLDVAMGELWVDGVTHDPRSDDLIEACAAMGDLAVVGS